MFKPGPRIKKKKALCTKGGKTNQSKQREG